MADQPSTACLDWADRLRTGRSIIPPPLFPDEAAAALDVFNQLKIVDAIGSPTFGEATGQWVQDLVASIFGSYDRQSGRRLVKEWFVLLPKKNAKSTVAAGIMQTALILNERQSAEFTVIAPTIEVAANTFKPAKEMIAHDDDLSELMKVQSHLRLITNLDTGAELKIVAADANTVSGKKSVGVLVEELWLFGKMPNAANIFSEAFGGMASRPEGFVIYITTQSDDPPAGEFKKKLDYARRVRDGEVIDPQFVPIIYEHPPEMVASGEHMTLEAMPMVNPNFGVSVDSEFLQREFTKAKDGGPDSLRLFMAKHANVQVGLATRSDRWVGADFWLSCARKMTLSDILERSEVCTVGIDGGGLEDLLGLAVLGRDRETRQWFAWCHAWAHPSVLERHKQIASVLRDFEKAGDLTIVDRIGDDAAGVAAIVREVYDSGLLHGVGMDAAGVGLILDALDEVEIPVDKVEGVSQGWRLGGTIKTTERKLAEGALLHCSQPMMVWCVSNARVEPKGNAILITKQASGSGKIDPLMGLFNAVSLMAKNPAATANIDQFISSPLIM